MKVILFGDSLLAGMGKDLVKELEAQVPGADVYNCSVSGWDTNDGLKKSPYISKLKPDVVILGFGTNDAAPWKQVPLEKFLENIPKIVKEFAGSKVVYFLPPPVHPENGWENQKRFPEVVQQYHDEAKKLLKELGVAYLDSHAVFKPLLNKDESYHVNDGVHLNEHGYEVLIRELAIKIVE